MPRVSATSNPTNLIEIDRSRVEVKITQTPTGRSFQLTKLDLADLDLDDDLEVICVARAGNTAKRFALGPVRAWSRSTYSIDGLERDARLRFRVLLRRKDDPKLVASVENVRTVGDGQSESLLPMTPADLGEELWRLCASESEPPELLYNKEVFLSAAGAESYPPFAALVLPEALRQILRVIAAEPGLLDEGAEYHLWGTWLDSLGVDRPVDDMDETERREWCDSVVKAFCQREGFATQLRAHISKENARD